MDDRLTDLEMLLMHLQKTVQELDDVVRSQGADFDGLDRDLKRLNLEYGLFRERDIDQRSAEEERPPHY